MKAERIAELRRLAEHGWTKRERIETLDEIRRLRSEIELAHYPDSPDITMRRACACERWFYKGHSWDHDGFRTAHAAHVASLLDGSDESMRDITLVCRPSEHHATQ